MAPEMIDRSPRAESHTLRVEEQRLRTYLTDRFGIRTRFAPLADVRRPLVRQQLVAGQIQVRERGDALGHEQVHLERIDAGELLVAE